MNKIVTIIIIIIIFGAGFWFINKPSSGSEKNDSSKTETVKTFVKMKPFTLLDYDGNEISSDNFKGKALVVNSWAAWCPFCVKELSDFVELQKKYGDNVVVIAIDRAESLEKAKRFTDSLGVSDGIVFLLDTKDSFYKSIGGFSMPETIFVDTDGNILVHKRGPMELSEMSDNVEKIIGKTI